MTASDADCPALELLATLYVEAAALLAELEHGIEASGFSDEVVEALARAEAILERCARLTRSLDTVPDAAGRRMARARAEEVRERLAAARARACERAATFQSEHRAVEAALKASGDLDHDPRRTLVEV